MVYDGSWEEQRVPVRGDLDSLDRVIQALPEAERRHLLDFARLLLRKQRGRTASFLDVPDPMPADEAEQFSRRISDAFESLDHDD